MPLSTVFKLYCGGTVLLVEETGKPGENHRYVTSYYKLYHITLYRVHLAMNGVRTHYISGDRH